jgi:hypothetical protein
MDKNKSKYITEQQITKKKQMNPKQMWDNPPPSAVGCSHSGYEALLVNEKHNLDKTKTEYNIEVNMTVRCKDIVKRRSLLNVSNLISNT